ncbi:WD40 repeat-like protein [Rhizoctonia solani]|uniref:WD40 repeat-like protein n=1 Tax=Rhizoctonia solani TaxID=456999 RepID=A0A8H7H2G8_9AGAM|nr:WD40 repeat-like protein [Rhizoctonia solani]
MGDTRPQHGIMPFLMSLSDSIKHSKERLKRSLGIKSKDNSRPSSAIGFHPGVTEKPSGAWAAIRALLTTLESSTDAFGPLKSAISGLKGLMDIYEDACKQRKEYNELGIRLKEMLQDLADHIEQPTGLVMTKSVKRIRDEIMEEAKRVANKQANKTGRRLIDAMEESDGIMECYRRIDGHLRRITLNASMGALEAIKEHTLESRMNRMSPHTSATYNSAESLDVQRGSCTSGTREAQLKELMEWANMPDTGKTCWMNGMAGTGKTTIAYTVCSKLDKSNRLGASFFCSRAIAECRQVKHIIPSIAYQLAKFSRPFRRALADVLEEDCDTHTQALNVQYQKLIIDPLKAVEKSLPEDFIVVVDALDECESLTAVEQILELLLSTTHTLPIRFLISSRPEREITERMTGRSNGQDEARLVLHNLDSNIVKTDIGTYMRKELKGIALEDSELTSIIERCGVLFIYAATICRYIKSANKMKTLKKAVRVIIDSGSVPMEKGDELMIDELYKTILDNAFKGSELNEANRRTMRDVLEMAVCATEPMSLDAMASLLQLDSAEQLEALLGPLRSVLNVTKKAKLVTTLHASFPDFILSQGRSGNYYCNPNTRHATIAEACLRLIDGAEPKFNICALPSSFLLDDQVKDLAHRVTHSISPGLVYACRYWTTHLTLGEHTNRLTGLVGGFFQSRLLLWMEVMNLTKNIRYATSIIQNAEKWCTERDVPEHVTKLAHDASQFVSVYANHPVSQSTPHIYASMLPFWPRSRPLSSTYMPRTSGLVQPTGTAIDRRRLALIATWKVSTGEVRSMSLSRDGRRLVAPTAYSIEVYDTTTGESVVSLAEERTKNVYCVAISPDGSKVAFSDYLGTPYVWETANGGAVTQLLPDGVSGGYSLAFSPDGSRVACGLTNGEVYICALGQDVSSHGTLTGHTRYVLSVVFSSDGLHLASGSTDNTVRVWDVWTGQPVGTPFEGHTDLVWSVCSCRTDSRIASGSHDKTIRVWDPQTGQTVLGPLTGHSSAVYCVAFSHNGAFIASGSVDNTIRVYDTRTGHTVLGPLQGHTSYIRSVIFSPDSTRLFSCSADGTVRVWNVQDIDTSNPLPTTLPLSSAIPSTRYSRSGTRLVSGSQDGSIHVWDVATGQLVLGPLHGHQDYVVSVDYSADDLYIASGSGDKTLRIWDGLTGQDIYGPMKGHWGDVNCVRFSPDSTIVVSGSNDGTVRVWDVSTGQQVTQLFQGDRWILSVGISPDGHRVVCGSIDRKIVVLDRHGGTTLVGPIDAHEGSVRSVEFSQDGKRLVSGSDDQSVVIWDAETGKQLVVCGESGGALKDYVSSVSFSPNGLYVASGSSDHTVRVWDSENGKLIHGPLKAHTDGVACIQFSPDGSHLVSCSYDCTIRLWDVSFLATHPQGHNMILGQNINIPFVLDDDTTSGLWSLNADGWVVDSHGHRLVWVPSDLRMYLALPPNSSVINGQGDFRLDTDGWKIGEKWAECYLP